MRVTKQLAGVWLAALLLLPAGAWAAGANASADTYVSSATPSSNFGTATAINIGGGNTGLIQFDLSALPAGLAAANINKATMTFYVNTVAIAGAVDISQVTSAWTETGVNNGNRPTYLSPFLLGVPTSTSRQYVTVDVTQLVKDWVSGVARQPRRTDFRGGGSSDDGDRSGQQGKSDHEPPGVSGCGDPVGGSGGSDGTAR